MRHTPNVLLAGASRQLQELAHDSLYFRVINRVKEGSPSAVFRGLAELASQGELQSFVAFTDIAKLVVVVETAKRGREPSGKAMKGNRYAEMIRSIATLVRISGSQASNV